MGETIQHHEANEAIKSKEGGRDIFDIKKEMQEYQASLGEMKNPEEAKFTLGSETQEGMVKHLLASIEAQIQDSMGDVAKKAFNEENPLDAKLDKVIKETTTFSKTERIEIPGKGNLVVGEEGDKTIIGFSSKGNEKLSFQAMIDGINPTEVRAVLANSPTSQASLGYDASSGEIGVGYATKGKNWEAGVKVTQKGGSVGFTMRW